jgi:hypothetical protein
MWSESPIDLNRAAEIRQLLLQFGPSPYCDTSSSEESSSPQGHRSTIGSPLVLSRPTDLRGHFEMEHIHAPLEGASVFSDMQETDVSDGENMSEPGEGLADLSEPEHIGDEDDEHTGRKEEDCPVPRRSRFNHDIADRLRKTKREAWGPGVSTTTRVNFPKEGEQACQACFILHPESDLNVGKCGSLMCDTCWFAMSLRAPADGNICSVHPYGGKVIACFLPVKVPDFSDTHGEWAKDCDICTKSMTNFRSRWCEVPVCNECILRLSGETPLEFCFLCGRRGCFDYRRMGETFRKRFDLPVPPHPEEKTEDPYPGFQRGGETQVPRLHPDPYFWRSERRGVWDFCKENKFEAGREGHPEVMSKEEVVCQYANGKRPNLTPTRVDDAIREDISPSFGPGPNVDRHTEVKEPVDLSTQVLKFAKEVRPYWDHQDSNIDPCLALPRAGAMVLACPFCKGRDLKRYHYLKPKDSRLEMVFVPFRPIIATKEVLLPYLQGYKGMRDGSPFKEMRKHLRQCVMRTPEGQKQFSASMHSSITAKLLDPCFPPFFRTLSGDPPWKKK